MHYTIKDNLIREVTTINKNDSGDVLFEIIAEDEVNSITNQYSFISESFNHKSTHKTPQFEIGGHYYFLTIPIRDMKLIDEKITLSFHFFIYIFQDRLLFIGDRETILKVLKTVINSEVKKTESAFDLIHSFIKWICLNEYSYTNDLEARVEKLESAIVASEQDISFSKEILAVRKKVLYAKHYHEKLSDLVFEIMNNENDLFSASDVQKLEKIYRKVNNLGDKSAVLLEHTIQVREMYQSNIDVKQNNTMQKLTVITVIFSVLSIITGWFGMNFENMAILRHKYSYQATIICAVLIVLGLIRYFKKKGYL